MATPAHVTPGASGDTASAAHVDPGRPDDTATAADVAPGATRDTIAAANATPRRTRATVNTANATPRRTRDTVAAADVTPGRTGDAIAASAVPTAELGRRRHDLDSLLAVAVRVFNERGYDGTSMGDIAAASGLSKSSIYHHVEGKEQLLRLALERAVEPLFAVIQEPAAGQGPAIGRLQYVVYREVQVLTEQLPYVTLLLRVHGNTETERWALDQRRRFDRFVTGLVAQAASDGDVRTDVDASVVTRLLFGMINSLVEWYNPHSEEQPSGTAVVHGPTSATPRSHATRVGAGTRVATQSSSGTVAASTGTVTADALADAVVRLAFDGLRA